MAGEREKTRRRLSFQGGSVYWPDEHTKHGSAKSLEWELIKVALRGEPFHWTDGFVIFTSWHEQKQRKKDYIAMFRTIRSRAKGKLESLGVEGLRIDYCDVRAGLWRLYTPAQGFECDIDEAVRRIRKARDEFREGHIETGWLSIKKAFERYEAHVDAGSICQALVFAGSLPEEGETYQKCLEWIHGRVGAYRKTLIKASAKVMELALKERQGINGEIAGPAIARWMGELDDVDHVLLLLAQKARPEPAPIEAKIREFVALANECGEYISYMREGDFTDTPAELEAANNVFEALSDQLRRCALVIDIAEAAVRHYADLGHSAAGKEKVYGCLQEALHDFLMTSAFPIQEDNSIKGHLSQYLTKYVAQFYRGQGITNVMDSQMDLSNKREELTSFFERGPDRERVMQLLGTMARRHGDHGEIAALAPHGVRPSGPPYYLQSAEDVLRVDIPDERAEWFRDGGPALCDFKKGMFYRRPEVNVLKERVLTKRCCILRGEAASAKTVIVRTLMYDLYTPGNMNVYCFDVMPKRDFNADRLVSHILKIDGLIVIENAHLEAEKIGWVCGRFRNDPERHFLLTWQTPDTDTQYPQPTELSWADTVTLMPFQDVEQLMDAYCSDPSTPAVVQQKRQEIMGVSQGDFWLLARACKACGQLGGQGEPMSWIAGAIEKRLIYLETRRERYAPQYPRIIVALSALYRDGVSTEQGFLKKLGFSKPALNDLAERREITRHTSTDGHVFYGLPYVSLAKAYWKHGKEYKEDLPPYEDLLYDYVASGAANALEALANSEYVHIFTSRLHDGKKLFGVIENERSWETLRRWARYCLRPDILLDDELLNICAGKVRHPRDFAGWLSLMMSIDMYTAAESHVYNIGPDDHQKVYGSLGNVRTAFFLSRVEDVAYVWHFLSHVNRSDPKLAFEIADRVEAEELAARLNRCVEPGDIVTDLKLICEANPHAGARLWHRIDRRRLAAMLASGERGFTIGYLEDIYRALKYLRKAQEIAPVLQKLKSIRGNRRIEGWRCYLDSVGKSRTDLRDELERILSD
jgi:hypothetical protein